MPLYEYLCDACGHRFEKIQKFSDPLIDECPKCGAKDVHKLVSSPAIQFKGSGWYITDYAKKNTVDAANAAADSKDGESKGSDSKSADAKTGESKTESKTGDSKTTESKSSESKSSESKTSDTKATTTSTS
jgi:putative FmdB family regulatory protein